MKLGSSQIWRDEGDAVAFDHVAWEFKSRQFFATAQQLLADFETAKNAPTFQVISLLTTGQFIASLALELIAKALYLKRNDGPIEHIYSHNVLDLCGPNLFSDDQAKLMCFAARSVVWAGRYPTPKWITEKQKEDHDVPSVFIDGLEHINALDFPNSASPFQLRQLLNLYPHIHAAWTQVAKQ